MSVIYKNILALNLNDLDMFPEETLIRISNYQLITIGDIKRLSPSMAQMPYGEVAIIQSNAPNTWTVIAITEESAKSQGKEVYDSFLNLFWKSL